MKRSLFVASSMAAALAGCARVSNALSDNQSLHRILGSAESLDDALLGTRGRARLYRPEDITRDFPVNGLPTPHQAEYVGYLQDDFASYRLPVSGLVERPQAFSLAELRRLASLDEITRHDCVEGWSVVGRWRGVPLGSFLRLVRPKPAARFVVFHSFDTDDSGSPFYGSLDLAQAAHPQTQLALDLNGAPLDAGHGAPVRLRVPTQLAYKSTKWIKSIELVASLGPIFGGHGGYWEDNGYAWYAGI